HRGGPGGRERGRPGPSAESARGDNDGAARPPKRELHARGLHASGAHPHAARRRTQWIGCCVAMAASSQNLAPRAMGVKAAAKLGVSTPSRPTTLDFEFGSIEDFDQAEQSRR